VALPEAFKGETAPGIPIGRWWERFNDPALNALVAEAFSGNLDLAQAYARLDQFEAVAKATGGAEIPAISAQGEWSREDTPSFFGNNTGNSYRYSAAASYEVDLWRKLRSRTRASRIEMQASRDDVAALYQTLAALVVDTYYLAVEQRAQLALTDRTIQSFADTVARVERRYREGLVPALDVYQARQNLAAAKSQRPLFEASLAQAEHGLAALLGRYPEGGTSGDLVTLPLTPAAFPAGLPSELLGRRPDVQAALLRLEASDARIAAAIAERFPSFNLIGNRGESSVAFSTGDIEGAFWKILVDAALPLVDGGRRRAEVERNRAIFRENLAGYHQTVLTAFQEVEDALVRNKTTEERITRLEERVEASDAALRLSLKRYVQGISDYLPVLTAQALAFDAESDLLAARRQLISDRVSLARALGGHWMLDAMRDQRGRENAPDASGNQAETGTVSMMRAAPGRGTLGGTVPQRDDHL
jgi:NodT family efflux transporter outer membrane factor (OMF) lipoprotein